MPVIARYKPGMRYKTIHGGNVQDAEDATCNSPGVGIIANTEQAIQVMLDKHKSRVLNSPIKIVIISVANSQSGLIITQQYVNSDEPKPLL